MFAVAALSPHIPIGQPPLNSIPATVGWPRLRGVWQKSQFARRTRYAPHCRRSAGSGALTAAVTGSGVERIRYFTGKIILVCGNSWRIGGRERMYTITAA